MDKKNNKLKMAVIAGAVAAINYTKVNKMATQEEIIKSVTKDVAQKTYEQINGLVQKLIKDEISIKI